MSNPLSLAQLQKEIAHFVFDPERNDRLSVLDVSSVERFDVYRNNVTASLIDVLRQAFPKTSTILSSHTFTKLASDFIARTPPSSARLSLYGHDFPQFLEETLTDDSSALLADLARLEWLRIESYFAPEAIPLTPEDFRNRLSTLTLTDYEELRIILVDSLRVLRSIHPLFEIWQDAAQFTASRMAAQSSQDLVTTGQPATRIPLERGGILVARAHNASDKKEFHGTAISSDYVWHTEIGPAETTFLIKTLEGFPVQQAGAELEKVDPTFDLSEFLGYLISERLIKDLQANGEKK